MADDPLRQQVLKYLDAQYPHSTRAHPLSFVLNHQARTAAGVLGCCHCDNPEGAHP